MDRDYLLACAEVLTGQMERQMQVEQVEELTETNPQTRGAVKDAPRPPKGWEWATELEIITSMPFRFLAKGLSGPKLSRESVQG